MRRYYANLMRRELVQPIFSHDIQAMADFGLRYESLPRGGRRWKSTRCSTTRSSCTCC